MLTVDALRCGRGGGREIGIDTVFAQVSRVRTLARTEAFQQSRCERKKVEMRFAHMKRILRLDRLRLRGLIGVRDEVLLAATAQNLKRFVKLLARSPSSSAAACPA